MDHMGLTLSLDLGPHEVNLVWTEISTRLAGADSRDAIHTAGMKTLGDVDDYALAGERHDDMPCAPDGEE